MNKKFMYYVLSKKLKCRLFENVDYFFKMCFKQENSRIIRNDGFNQDLDQLIIWNTSQTGRTLSDPTCRNGSKHQGLAASGRWRRSSSRPKPCKADGNQLNAVSVWSNYIGSRYVAQILSKYLLISALAPYMNRLKQELNVCVPYNISFV